MVSREGIVAALNRVPGPDGKTPLPESGALGGIVLREDRVFVSLELADARSPAAERLRLAVETLLRGLDGVGAAFVTLTSQKPEQSGAVPPTVVARSGHTHNHAPPGNAATAPGPKATAARNAAAVTGVKTIIAVASGKGGVGKSTTACNLALALRLSGLRVALLDADIYGPSVPRLLGLSSKPEIVEGRLMRPLEGYGMKVMSIGFLVEEETPMIWRGPMVMSAITQMLREVAWGEIDVMVVDMPPGTGDAQLTMAQSVPLAGAVIVSTPQDLALIDARRGIAMFRRVEVPILGIVENMSTFVCPHCGTRTDIFGHGGAEHEAERLGVRYLGGVPLALDIRTSSDAGRPIVLAEPDGPHAEAYRNIARGVMAALEDRVARPAPRIVIE